MSVTLFGSCRIDNKYHNNNLNNHINYPHSTKEVLQQIKFLMGLISFPEPFNKICFRGGITENNPILYNPEFTRIFNESTICFVEICSDKTYIYDNYYLHHLSVDKRYYELHKNQDDLRFIKNTPQTILDNYKCIKQTHAEIETDILEIKKLLKSKKMILVTHYNSKLNGEYLPSRHDLITFLMTISEKYNIPIINPTDVLKDYEQTDVMKDDLGHYTYFGKIKMEEYLTEYTKNIL
jgi:hypothetical protein